MTSVLERLITTVLTYLNAAGYYKSAEEIQNAINVAQLDLYKRLRGNMAQYVPGRPLAAANPEQNILSSDAIGELLVEATTENLKVGVSPTPSQTTNVQIDTDFFGKTIDFVLSLEINYPTQTDGSYYPVNTVPDNQFLMMKNNPVIPPVETRPLGRLVGFEGNYIVYEVCPYNAAPAHVKARCVILPTPVAFTFVDNGGPLPTIIVTQDTVFTSEKLDNLVYGTVANLGFNLSNGVLVQSGNNMNEKIL
jgi:hypothetical protein